MKKILAWLSGSTGGFSIAQIIGINLAGVSFFAGVVVPQTQSIVSTTEVYLKTKKTAVSEIPTTNTLRWPLEQARVSQWFSLVHPGIDLPAPYGTPIYPIESGTIAWTMALPWGYGKHVLVRHSDHVSALYAHMSKVEVKQGDTVTPNSEIGQIGATGWATGNHLHMEIYQDNLPVNPIEVLPNLTSSLSSL